MRNQVISQQQLWRPAEEVLHFLTECRPEQSSPAPLYKEGIIVPTPCTEVPKASSNVKRQAPAVWRPPVAMKPQIPGPPLHQPKEEPKPDFTSSSFLGDNKDSEQAMVDTDTRAVREISTGGSSARDWHNFFGGESNAHLVNLDLGGFAGTQLMPPPRAPTEAHNGGAHQVLESNKLFPRQDLQLSVFPNPFIENSSVEFSSSHFQVNADAMIASSSIVPSSSVQDKGADLLLKQRIGVVSPFMKQQVAQTPLFSGLGIVSFGSGSFSQPPTSNSIFTQSPGFGSQGTAGEGQVANLRSSSTTLSFGSGSFSVQPPRNFAAFGGERMGSTAGEQQQAVNLRLGSTTSASERGSSDSPAGITDVGGLKPKELPGKSLVNNPGGNDTAIAPASVHEKLPSVAANANADAATTGTGPRKLRTRPLDLLMNAIKVAAPKPSNVAQAADSQGKEPAPANLPAAQQQQARAYFMHTGAWIVQKKSTRHAKNAFKKRAEVNASSGAKASSKKRSLTAISQTDKQGKNQPMIHDKKKKTEKQQLDKQLAIHAPKKTKKAEKQEKTKLNKPVNTTKKNNMDNTKNKNTPLEAELVLPVDNDAPLIRSKRGRSQALPSRLRDSVINKVKKKSRKG